MRSRCGRSPARRGPETSRSSNAARPERVHSPDRRAKPSSPSSRPEATTPSARNVPGHRLPVTWISRSPARACQRWRVPRTSSWSRSPGAEARANRACQMTGRGAGGISSVASNGSAVRGSWSPRSRNRRLPRVTRIFRSVLGFLERIGLSASAMSTVPSACRSTSRLARSSTSVPRRGRSKVCQRLRSQVARGAARTRSPWRSRSTTPVIRVGRNQESRIEATSRPPGARI